MAENLRDYEVSVWTLQDSYLTTLKWSGIEHKGQIQEPKMKISDDGTEEFTFKIPMYLWVQSGTNLVKRENPIWYTTREGIIVQNMRKIKVIFNKTFGSEEQKKENNEKVFEFLIVKVEDQHEEDQCTCEISCEGLAFHELGHQGYKRELSSELFYDRNNKYCEGKTWYDSFNYGHLEQPIANIDYWLNDLGIENKFLQRVYDKTGIYTRVKKRKASDLNSSEWYYEVRMNTAEYSLTKDGKERDPQVIYEDEYIKSWNNDLMPTTVSEVKEKERMVDASESNYYNLTQTVAETFGVFCKYEYSYDQNYQITGRTIVFYNTFLKDYEGGDFGELTYPNTATSISREYDSTDITTKMFVRPETDESVYTGQVSIIDSDANPTKEDYILNFDYLHRIGTISDEQYKEIGIFEKRMRLFNCGDADLVKAAEERGKNAIVTYDDDKRIIKIEGLNGTIKRNQTVIVDGVEYIYSGGRWYYLTSLNTCQGIIDLQQQLINKQAEKVTIDAKCAMIEKELAEALERKSDAHSRMTNLGIQKLTKDNPAVRQTTIEATKVLDPDTQKSETRYTVELGSNHKGIIEDTIHIYLEYDTTKYEFNDVTTPIGIPEANPLKINWNSDTAKRAIKDYVRWYNKDHVGSATSEAIAEGIFKGWLEDINSGDGLGSETYIPQATTHNVTTNHTYDLYNDAVAWIAYACGKASIGIVSKTYFNKRMCKSLTFNGKEYSLVTTTQQLVAVKNAKNSDQLKAIQYQGGKEIKAKSWNAQVAARRAWCAQFIYGMKPSYITPSGSGSEASVNVTLEWDKTAGTNITVSIDRYGAVTWRHEKTSQTSRDLKSLYDKVKSTDAQSGLPQSYPEFCSQNFGIDWEVNHVKSFSVQKDKNGNINRITHLILDKADVSTVYLLYEFDPDLYYKQIEDMWNRKWEIKSTEEKDYKNKKAKNKLEIEALEAAVRVKLQAKFEEIQRFDHVMGPALRESYWQPENYQNYGDIYSQNINIDFYDLGLIRDNDDISAKFFWDDELFPDEDKNYYEMGVNLDRHYYPCINLKAFLEDYGQIDNFFANLKYLTFSFYNDGVDKSYYDKDKNAYVLKYPIHVNGGKWEYQLNYLSDEDTSVKPMIYNRTVERSEADRVFYVNGSGMKLAFVRDNHGEVIPVLMVTEMDTLPDDVIHFIYQESSLEPDSQGIIHPGALPMLGCYLEKTDEEIDKMEGTATDESTSVYAVPNTMSKDDMATASQSQQGVLSQIMDASHDGKFYAFGIVKPWHWLEYDPTSIDFTVEFVSEEDENTMWKEISETGGLTGRVGGSGSGSMSGEMTGGSGQVGPDVSDQTSDGSGYMWGEITGGTGEAILKTKVIKDRYTMVYPRISINSLQLKTAETQLTLGQTLLPKPQFYYLFVRGNDYLLTIKPTVLFSNIVSKNKVYNIVKDYFFGSSTSSQGVTKDITKITEEKLSGGKDQLLVIRKNQSNTFTGTYVDGFYTGTYSNNKIIGSTPEIVETEFERIIGQQTTMIDKKTKYVSTSGPFTLTYTIGNGGTYVYVDAIRVLKENSVPKVSYTFTPNLLGVNVVGRNSQTDVSDENEYEVITGGSSTMANVEGFSYDDWVKYVEQNSLDSKTNRIVSNLYNRLGQVMMINDYELKFVNVFGYISSVDLDLDEPWEDSVEIKNYKNKFEDLFSSITAEAEEMKKNGGILATFNAGNLLPVTTMSLSDLIEDLLFNSQRFANMWDSRFDTREQVVNELSKAIREANEILDYGVDAVQELQELNDQNAMLLYNMAQNIKAMVTPRIYRGDPAQIKNLKPGDVIIGTDNKRYLSSGYGDSDSAGIFPYFDGTVSRLVGANVTWDANLGEVSIVGSNYIDIKGGGDITIAANEDINITGNKSVNIGGMMINIGSVIDNTLPGSNDYPGTIAGGINIMSSQIDNDKDTAASWVRIFPTEISMASSNITMQGSNRITMVASDVQSETGLANVSGISIDSTSGIFIGTNSGGVEIYSGNNSLEYDIDNDEVTGGADNRGSSVSIRPGRILMGVVNDNPNDAIEHAAAQTAQSYNENATTSGTALKITKDFLVIGSVGDVNGITTITNAPAYTNKITGAYIGAKQISFATINSNKRNLISLGDDGILFANAEIDSGAGKYYVYNTDGTTSASSTTMLSDNIVGSYVQINSKGIKLGSTANIYINTDNLKLQTMKNDGTTGAGATIFALGSGLQSITTLAQAQAGNVQLFSNGSDFMVRGAIYATALYIGNTNFIDLEDRISRAARSGGPSSYLKFSDDGLKVVSSDSNSFTGFEIKKDGINFTSNGSFVVNTTNFKLSPAGIDGYLFRVNNGANTQYMSFGTDGNLTISGKLYSGSGSEFNTGTIEASNIIGGTITGTEFISSAKVNNTIYTISMSGQRTNSLLITAKYNVPDENPPTTAASVLGSDVTLASVLASGVSTFCVSRDGVVRMSRGSIGRFEFDGEKLKTTSDSFMINITQPRGSKVQGTTYSYTGGDPYVLPAIQVGSSSDPKFHLTLGGYLRNGIYLTTAAYDGDPNKPVPGYARLYLNVGAPDDNNKREYTLKLVFYNPVTGSSASYDLKGTGTSNKI